MKTYEVLALLIVSLFVIILTESVTAASTFTSTKTESVRPVHEEIPRDNDDAKKPQKGKSQHNLNASDGYDAGKTKKQTTDSASVSPGTPSKNYRRHNL